MTVTALPIRPTPGVVYDQPAEVIPFRPVWELVFWNPLAIWTDDATTVWVEARTWPEAVQIAYADGHVPRAWELCATPVRRKA